MEGSSAWKKTIPVESLQSYEELLSKRKAKFGHKVKLNMESNTYQVIAVVVKSTRRGLNDIRLDMRVHGSMVLVQLSWEPSVGGHYHHNLHLNLTIPGVDFYATKIVLKHPEWTRSGAWVNLVEEGTKVEIEFQDDTGSLTFHIPTIPVPYPSSESSLSSSSSPLPALEEPVQPPAAGHSPPRHVNSPYPDPTPPGPSSGGAVTDP